MKNTNNTADAPSKLSWLQRLKVAIVALAFVAAGVFGASAVAEVPAPEADETAWSTQKVDLSSYRDGGGLPFTGYSRSGSWS